MEEAELLKERLQAITDKRKLQEDIAQKRLKVEEEKLKLHHLKKKALREKWLLDGLSTMSPEEQEQMLRQNQEDQEQVKYLDSNITRLEKEIDILEKEEIQLSAKEVRVLQRLKSVERTNEDVIKAVKAEVREVEPVTEHDIYAGIPDLPPSFKPSFIRRLESTQEENGEDQRKALYAMEIKVAKDMKTGKSTVLSSIPVPSVEFKDTGVKVYDDGRKSVYAVRSDRSVSQNGVDSLAPIEVEDLLRKATAKSTQSPTEYHEPVYSNPYNTVSTHQGQISPRPNGQISPLQNTNISTQDFFPVSNQNGKHPGETKLYTKTSREISQTLESPVEEPRLSQSSQTVIAQRVQSIDEPTEYQMKPMENHHEATLIHSGNGTEDNSAFEDDIHYSIVHATPCFVDDSEPVTMIFMGYQHADDTDAKPLSDYEGVIRAELVVIDDDEDDVHMEENHQKGHTFTPINQSNQLYKAAPSVNNVQKQKQNITLQNQIPYKNSITLQEQEEHLGHHNYPLQTSQTFDDGTEDPSLTALRIRMAKLGKKVI
ncbi:palmdelphin [Discoglossus pictus]